MARGEYKDIQGVDQYNPDTSEFNDATTADLVIDEAIYRKTLTMASIQAVPERCIERKKAVVLCRISGVVSGTERQALSTDASKPDHEKTWFEALVGQFEAVIYTTDQGSAGASMRYRGGYCYLPGGFHEQVVAGYKSSLARTHLIDPEGAVEQAFSFEFASMPARNPRGYSYIGRSVMRKDRTMDALDRLAVEAALVNRNADAPLLLERPI